MCYHLVTDNSDFCFDCIIQVYVIIHYLMSVLDYKFNLELKISGNPPLVSGGITSETCYRSSPFLSDENEEIVDLLVGLTEARKTWG